MIGLGFAVARTSRGIFSGSIRPCGSCAFSHMVGQSLGITFHRLRADLVIRQCLVDLVGVRRVLAFSGVRLYRRSALVLSRVLLTCRTITYPLALLGLLLTASLGCCEAATKPDGRRIYPDQKAIASILLHAWCPLVLWWEVCWDWVCCFARSLASQSVVLIMPALLLLWLALSTTFPVTERVASGASYGDMSSCIGSSASVHPVVCLHDADCRLGTDPGPVGGAGAVSSRGMARDHPAGVRQRADVVMRHFCRCVRAPLLIDRHLVVRKACWRFACMG